MRTAEILQESNATLAALISLYVGVNSLGLKKISHPIALLDFEVSLVLDPSHPS